MMLLSVIQPNGHPTVLVGWWFGIAGFPGSRADGARTCAGKRSSWGGGARVFEIDLSSVECSEFAIIFVRLFRYS